MPRYRIRLKSKNGPYTEVEGFDIIQAALRLSGDNHVNDIYSITLVEEGNKEDGTSS